MKDFVLWWNYQISPMNWIMAFMMFFFFISSFSFKKMNFLNMSKMKSKYIKNFYAF